MDPVCRSTPAVVTRRRGYHIAKRMMDIGLCILAIPVLIPLLAVVSILIRLDSSGPVVLVQERVGKGGRRFCMFKFRTLHPIPDNSAHKEHMRDFVRAKIEVHSSGMGIYKPFPASRVTGVGRFLRRFGLDELPQVVNVLRGEMSLVGPRPNVPWEVEEYGAWHYKRLEALPGITGLAQVRGRSSLSFDRIVAYDIEYLEQQSLLLDLRILLWTIPFVFSGQGAC